MFADYVHEETGEILTYRKPYGADWPSEVEDADGKIYKRSYSRSTLVFQVAQGHVGNAADGYKGDKTTYHPAGLTPMNAVSKFGKAGRTAGVETEGL